MVTERASRAGCIQIRPALSYPIDGAVNSRSRRGDEPSSFGIVSEIPRGRSVERGYGRSRLTTDLLVPAKRLLMQPIVSGGRAVNLDSERSVTMAELKTDQRSMLEVTL